MKDNKTLGQKIRTFRELKGLSQFQLEIEIGASSGSLSRIESDQINPTKETLIKIIQVLNLNPREATSLFGIHIDDKLEEIVKSTKSLNEKLDLNHVLQSSVNEVVYELGLLSGFITLVKGNRIYAHTTTQNWVSKVSLKILPKPLNEMFVDLDTNSTNLMVRAVLDQKIYISDELADFIVPAVNRTISNILQKITGAKSGIALPIILKGESLGAIFFGKNSIDDFNEEVGILRAFTEHVAYAINNAKQYEELQEKYNSLKKVNDFQV